MNEVTIFWMCDKPTKDNIVRAFGLPEYVSLNGETPARVTDAVLERLRKGELKGYLKLRNK